MYEGRRQPTAYRGRQTAKDQEKQQIISSNFENHPALQKASEKKTPKIKNGMLLIRGVSISL